MISIAHKIELVPNNKQKTYFRKAFGCARFAYNWGLAEAKKRYEAGEKFSWMDIQKSFASIKEKDFPFTYEVTKYASEKPFKQLGHAFNKFFKDLKKGIVSYPQFKRKKDNCGRFYFSGVKLYEFATKHPMFKNQQLDVYGKKQYVFVPVLGPVKLRERVRFNGKIKGVVISQSGDRYFASFNMMITEDEYKRTHAHLKEFTKEKSVGVDVGVKSALVLSDGIAIESPKPLKKNLRKIKRLSRQLEKRSHAKTKQERLEGKKKSNNYKKLSVKLSNVYRRTSNIRRDFTHKVTTILTTHYGLIAMEDLNVKEMAQNHRLSQSISDVAFGEIGRQIEYKSKYNGIVVKKADRFYPSSKTCSICGNIKHDLRLSERTYRCDKCGAVIDRDYNASLNLLSLLSNIRIGSSSPEFTPADLTALLLRFERNGIATSKMETGKQQVAP